MPESDALTHYLRFADEHVGPIQAGEKYVTARYDLERAIRPNDTIECRNQADDVFATARVESVTETTVKQFADAEHAGHRSYDGILVCVADLKDYYPEVHFKPDTALTVITWAPESVEVCV